MTRRHLYVISSAAVIAAASVAWGAKGILNPDWSKPTRGSHDAPAAEVGTKTTTAAPWSVTTITSSVNGQPVRGKPVTVVGEIVDLSCYLQVGKHGDKHRDCGQKCARAGQPVGLLEKNGTIHMLIDEEHDPRRDGLTTFRQWCVDNMAHVVTVNGTQTVVEGQRAIFVQGYVKKL